MTLAKVCSEPVYTKRFDRQFARACSYQVCDYAPHRRGKLKAMRRKPKAVESIFLPAWADNGNPIGHFPFNARPAADNCGLLHDGENTYGGSGIGSQSGGI
ncbi:MAG: hypothetical protein V1245_06480 [Arenicellales bacterium]|nr:hypothetical protein [Arenicellales bacterium]